MNCVLQCHTALWGLCTVRILDLCDLCLSKVQQNPVPTRGSGWITFHSSGFFLQRQNLLHTRKQNSAVDSPAKYAVNILDESKNKNVNALGKAPHCIVLSFSLNPALPNQCMGPEQCK